MENLINQLGLDETEGKVYLALLELGPATVAEITKKAGINRTLGYYALEKLGWYGLVDRATGKGSKMVYTAENPGRLIQHIKNKKRQWEDKLINVEKLLPKLFSIYKFAEKPVIKYQEGTQGLKNIYWESLDSKTEILSIADFEGWSWPEFKSWGEGYNRERSKRKIHERIIALDTPTARTWMKNYKGSMTYTHIKWLKPNQLPGIEDFFGEINIFGSKVIFVTHKPHKIGVMIESKSLVKILKALYELAWNTAVPLPMLAKRKKK